MIAWHKGFLYRVEDTFRRSGPGRAVTDRLRREFPASPVVPAWSLGPPKALSCFSQALEKVVAEVPGCPGLVPWSSCQRSTQRRRAFMKKLLTVLSSKPSCWEMVICISLDGRLFSLKMAMSVRRCRSVKTRRCFLGAVLRSLCCSCSLRLQAWCGLYRWEGWE